ncbi:hypothetical protein Krad_2491 [Kineococcus radiotolerans SRS30216 = ATCC BAA-149]|uniref:Uncharacterized protein n=1 Tax=Kineococcus radiotolerans (strain ATCC BAA-149 / DSM 14245 / SRS30216) TaxID=266940 RepID=A6WAX8_KINRD|nr:hypothetical protein Krad_2491 [Kineococcus radiotolerans SRS30216 = ATCC BAA-149]
MHQVVSVVPTARSSVAGDMATDPSRAAQVVTFALPPATAHRTLKLGVLHAGDHVLTGRNRPPEDDDPEDDHPEEAGRHRRCT